MSGPESRGQVFKWTEKWGQVLEVVSTVCMQVLGLVRKVCVWSVKFSLGPRPCIAMIN